MEKVGKVRREGTRNPVGPPRGGGEVGDQGLTGESQGHRRGPGRGADGVDTPQGLRSLWRLAEGGLRG